MILFGEFPVHSQDILNSIYFLKVTKNHLVMCSLHVECCLILIVCCLFQLHHKAILIMAKARDLLQKRAMMSS